MILRNVKFLVKMLELLGKIKITVANSGKYI